MTAHGDRFQVRGLEFTAPEVSPGHWLLRLRDLEDEGCYLISGRSRGAVEEATAHLLTPEGVLHQLRRDADRLIFVDGYVRDGTFYVGHEVPDGCERLSLLLDTGTTVNVAGRRWGTLLRLLPGPGRHLRGVGGFMPSAGHGTLDLCFPRAPSAVRTRLPLVGGSSPREVYLAAGTTPPMIATVERSDDVSGLADVLAKCTRFSAGEQLSGPGEQAWIALDTGCAPSRPAEPAPAATPSRASELRSSGKPRPSSRFKPLAGSDFTKRLNITNPKVLRDVKSLFVGAKALSGIEVHKAGVKDLPLRLATHIKRRVASARSAASEAERALWKVGEHHTMDATGRMPMSLDGFFYALVYVCLVSDYVTVYFLKEKTSATVVDTMEDMRVTAASMGRVFREVRTDADPVWYCPGRGDDIATAAVKEFQRRHNDGFKLKPAPPGRQEMNPCEPTMGTLFAFMSVNEKRGFLAHDPTWPDMFKAGVVQLNLHPVPTKRGSLSQFMTRYEVYWGFPYDVSRFITYPGAPVFVHRTGTKASRGDDKAEPAYFCYPSQTTGGFVVRLLKSLKLYCAYDVSVVTEPRAVLGSLLNVEGLYRGHALARGREQRTREKAETLFEFADVNPSDSVTIVDPCGEPVRVVPYYDPQLEVLRMAVPDGTNAAATRPPGGGWWGFTARLVGRWMLPRVMRMWWGPTARSVARRMLPRAPRWEEATPSPRPLPSRRCVRGPSVPPRPPSRGSLPAPGSLLTRATRSPGRPGRGTRSIAPRRLSRSLWTSGTTRPGSG